MDGSVCCWKRSGKAQGGRPAPATKCIPLYSRTLQSILFSWFKENGKAMRGLLGREEVGAETGRKTYPA